MPRIIVTNKLSKRVLSGFNIGESNSFISFRDLSKKEIKTARDFNIQRYIFTNLDDNAAKEFFDELNIFWDSLIEPFDSQHPFWRNVVSTKMQEWEKSPIYFILVLYSLLKSESEKNAESVIIICDSIEEKQVCLQWGGVNGWEVLDRYFINYPNLIVRFAQEVENLIDFSIIALKLIIKKVFSPKVKLAQNIKKNKILISTLYYENCFAGGEYKDHFFGELEDELVKQNFEVDYLAGPLGDYFRTVKFAAKKKSFFIPYSFVSWADLVKIFFSRLTKRIFVKHAVFKKLDVSALINWCIWRNISFFNCDAQVYYIAVKNMCQNTDYVKLIQLYEGNIIEKAAIQAFRRFSSGSITGYSHAVVYPLNLKIYRTKADVFCGPSPDVIVSSGTETKTLLSGCGDYKSIPIYSGCSLREFPNVNVPEDRENQEKNTILIALDGTWSCMVFLDWILRNFKYLKGDYEIVLRGHPNVPVSGLLKQCINPLPENFYLSSNKLDADLSRCLCVVYRQSSVGLQTLMNGIPVIQLSIDSPLNGDPIANFSELKWVVDSMNDFNQALNEIRVIKAQDKEFAIVKAKDYSEKYFASLDKDTLLSFLR